MKHDIASDATYNAGLPDFTEDEIQKMYLKAGVDIVTGLPLDSVRLRKDTGGKVALASGNLSAGVLAFDAPTWAFIAAARSCGCISCEGVLANIQSAVVYFVNPGFSNTRRARMAKNQAKQNRQYFYSRLRSIVMSVSIKHNVK